MLTGRVWQRKRHATGVDSGRALAAGFGASPYVMYIDDTADRKRHTTEPENTPVSLWQAYGHRHDTGMTQA